MIPSPRNRGAHTKIWMMILSPGKNPAACHACARAASRQATKSEPPSRKLCAHRGTLSVDPMHDIVGYEDGTPTSMKCLDRRSGLEPPPGSVQL
jgi:hypothetical protein